MIPAPFVVAPLLVVLYLSTPGAAAWAASTFTGRLSTRRQISAAWTMRDASASYWFKVGDVVKVTDDVVKAGTSLKGWSGVVMETWEKCDVDPTCCCAEQVDLGMAVRVQFGDANDESSFFHYFAEEELVKEPPKMAENLVFDGKSCTAFKLEQLEAHQSQPRRVASFEPQREDSGEGDAS